MHLTMRCVFLFICFAAFPAQAVTLPECPDSPNCVSSFATDEDHQIQPWEMPASNDTVRKALLYYLKNKSRVVITEQTETLIRAEFTSAIFGWVDDVEIRLDTAARVVHWRSASRTGYWDLGANRRRIEAIREWLDEHFDDSV